MLIKTYIELFFFKYKKLTSYKVTYELLSQLILKLFKQDQYHPLRQN